MGTDKELSDLLDFSMVSQALPILHPLHPQDSWERSTNRNSPNSQASHLFGWRGA